MKVKPKKSLGQHFLHNEAIAQRIAESLVVDDGVLNTLVIRKISRPTFLRFVGPYSKGEYAKFPKIANYSTAKEIRIRSDRPDIVTCLDGEIVHSDDMTIRLSDKRLNFFGPAGCNCNSNAR